MARSMDGLSRTYASLVDGTYDCVDRIVLNAYFGWHIIPGGFDLVEAAYRIGRRRWTTRI